MFHYIISTVGRIYYCYYFISTTIYIFSTIYLLFIYLLFLFIYKNIYNLHIYLYFIFSLVR